jgi:hypothetical protein
MRTKPRHGDDSPRECEGLARLKPWGSEDMACLIRGRDWSSRVQLLRTCLVHDAEWCLLGEGKSWSVVWALIFDRVSKQLRTSI